MLVHRFSSLEVAVDNRLAFVEHLIERGDFVAAQDELVRAKAELEETPDGWEIVQLDELRQRRSYTVEDIRAIREEAERRRAEWLGQAGPDS